MIETTTITCPYCGEVFSTTVDCSAGDQSYVEDCHICCQPIDFTTRISDQNELLGVEVHRGDD